MHKATFTHAFTIWLAELYVSISLHVTLLQGTRKPGEN